jgi:hypothetical protein
MKPIKGRRIQQVTRLDRPALEFVHPPEFTGPGKNWLLSKCVTCIEVRTETFTDYSTAPSGEVEGFCLSPKRRPSSDFPSYSTLIPSKFRRLWDCCLAFHFLKFIPCDVRKSPEKIFFFTHPFIICTNIY